MGCIKTPKLRHRITIQELSLSDDGRGGHTESWSTFKEVWAKIEPVSASQKWMAQQLEHHISHKIVIRAISGLSIDMRIKFGSRFFQIHSFRDIEERGKIVEIMAMEGQPT